jgi:predicted N-acetyltransferase YhbS
MTCIRAATPSDASTISELATQLGYPTSADETVERLAALPADDTLLVATDEHDRVIGWIHVALVTTVQSGTRAEIHGLVVDAMHRSEGSGAELVAAAEAWARLRAMPEIVVRSRSTRDRTHRFYERLGYAEIKRSHVFAKPIV